MINVKEPIAIDLIAVGNIELWGGCVKYLKTGGGGYKDRSYRQIGNYLLLINANLADAHVHKNNTSLLKPI